MKKHLVLLIFAVSIFIASCSNSTEPENKDVELTFLFNYLKFVNNGHKQGESGNFYYFISVWDKDTLLKNGLGQQVIIYKKPDEAISVKSLERLDISMQVGKCKFTETKDQEINIFCMVYESNKGLVAYGSRKITYPFSDGINAVNNIWLVDTLKQGYDIEFNYTLGKK